MLVNYITVRYIPFHASVLVFSHKVRSTAGGFISYFTSPPWNSSPIPSIWQMPLQPDGGKEYTAITCGSLCVIFFLIVLATSGNIPSTAPWWDARRVHTHYWAHLEGTQAGSVFIMVSGAFYVVHSAALMREIQKVTEIDPIIADLPFASAAALFSAFMLAAIAISLLTFRDYGAELTQLLNDLLWMALILAGPIFLKRGFDQSCCSIVYALGSGIHMHHTGPIAWNGGLVFLPMMVFFGLQINADLWYV
ncbi:hypothetical protein N7463_004718 [Penicillium fimorum]|uniref:Uncharacterized protein n=1 Tax=Penicillium fimorum TaxID=1882269 RepID=A0A9X0CAN8_9EURO|nr:hypothetical protein N7463_004718 [Penicillium fimorum]